MATQSGLSARQLRYRVQSGVLAKNGPKTYRYAGVELTVRQRLRLLMRDVGGRVWVSGPTAAALLGFDGFELAPPFHLTIERGRDVQRVGHKIHTSKILPSKDLCTIDEFPATRAARTIIDMARDEPPERLMTAIESAIRDRWMTEASLHKRIVELNSGGRFGIEKLLSALAERDRKLGAHSWLEREFLRLVERAGLPRPTCQEVMARTSDRLVRVDFRFPGTDVVVEVLGYAFHRSKQQMQRDAERLNALIIAGATPLQFTYDDVVSRPAQTIATVTQAIVSAQTTEFVVCADTTGRGGVRGTR